MNPGRRAFVASLLAVGASSVATQLAMVRELLAAFSGNELTIAVTIGLLLLSAGAGAKLGAGLARRPGTVFGVLFAGHLILAFLPLVQIAAVRGMPLLWTRGMAPGFSFFFPGALAVLAPYGILSGAMLPVAGRLWEGPDSTTRVYVTDTAGDILGGLLFGLFFVWTATHWQAMVFFGLAHLLAAFLVARAGGGGLGRKIAVGAAAALLLFSFAFEGATRKLTAPGQEIVLWKNTPFCRLVVTRTKSLLNIWQDGVLLFASDDPGVETLTHPALCLAPEKPRVLLLGGGVFGLLAEILKHHPRHIDYVELDRAVLSALPGAELSAPNVKTMVGDGRGFVARAKDEYDAIIVDLPGPENAQLNRFYTVEFFSRAKKILAPGGVLCFALTGAENYMEEQGLAENRSVYRAAAGVFPHVLVLPGEKNLFLASEKPLDPSGIENCLLSRGIATKRLLDFDLYSLTDPFRIDEAAGLLQKGDVPANTDLSPLAFGRTLDRWMALSKTSPAWIWAVVFLCVLFSLWGWRGSAKNFCVLTSGAAGMGIELALTLLFQVIYGYAYAMLCVFVTLFLLGSTAGAWRVARGAGRSRSFVAGTDAGVIALCLLCLGAAYAGVRVSSEAGSAFFAWLLLPALVFATGAVTGAQFSAVSYLSQKDEARTTGDLYLADLAGACLGTIVAGLLLVPRIGITGTLAAAAGLKVASLAGLGCAKKRDET
ncbi:MAG: hypothetical protein AB1921_14750 [Thermodesulfobacteriota bacterium]